MYQIFESRDGIPNAYVATAARESDLSPTREGRHLRPQPADNRAARRELGWTAQYDLAATMSACSAYLAGKGSGGAP